MTVDPVFRAVAHTGNAGDLLLAESPASTAFTVIMPQRRTQPQKDKAEVER